MRSWGRFVHGRRWLVLALSAALAGVGIALLLRGGDLNNNNTFDFESAHAMNLSTAQLPGQSQLQFIFSSQTLTESDSEFQRAVDAALADLRADHRVISITTPWQQAPQVASQNISFDHHKALVTATMREAFDQVRTDYTALRDKIHPRGGVSFLPASEPAVAAAFDHYSQSDIARAEAVSLPLAFILLLLVFGSVVAAFTCLLVGGLAVISGTGATLALSNFTNVSPYAVEVVTLVGLGVAIDYSLFIVSRFREELRNHGDPESALVTTMATAGRAILFSGLTVAIGLAGLLFFNGIFLVSLGLAGALVVALAVIYALTFLPALLAVLGPRINRLHIPLVRSHKYRSRFWIGTAKVVMRRPLTVLVPVAAVLILFVLPLPHLHIVESDVQQLPAQADARQGMNSLKHDFPGQSNSYFYTIVQFEQGSPTDAQNVAIAHALAMRYAGIPKIESVFSYVSVDPAETLQSYQAIYSKPRSQYPPVFANLVTQFTGKNIAVIEPRSSVDSESKAANDLVTKIRDASSIAGAKVYVDGSTAFSDDFVGFIAGRTPRAVVFVMLTTLFVLLVLFRSVLLPFKAVLMNLLSLAAALGAMVWVIQDGHLSGLLDFTASPIDPTLPVLMFCLVFGLSMDYEVFLLSRMQEAYHGSGDNTYAVAAGLEASARLITGAAAIMVAVFLGFALLAQEIVVKAIGLGMATAVIVDATLVRALVVPALMRLLGRANWWAPRWLSRVLPEIHIG